MANKLIEMQEIRQIIQLAHQGQSVRKISELTVVHRHSVKKYLEKALNTAQSLEDLLSFTDEGLAVILLEAPTDTADLNRRVQMEKLIPFFESELKRGGVPNQLLHQECLKLHPGG